MPAWTPERRGAQHVRQHCITPATPTSATALRQCPAPPPDGNAPCLSPLLPMMIRQRSTSSPPDRCINATLATAALYGLGSTPTMTTASHLRRLFLLQVSICLLRCDAHCDDWKDAGRPSGMPAWTPERRGAQHVRQHCITPATPTSATALRQCPAPPPDGNAPCLSPLLPMMIRQRSTSSPPDRCINATLATAALYGLGSTPTMTTASHLRRLFLLQVSICLLRCDAHCDDWKDAGRPSWMPAWTPERRGAQHVRQHCITPATPTSATALRQCPAPPPDGNAPCLSPLLPMMIRQRSTSSPPDRCINATLATAALYGLGSTPTMTTASHLRRLFLLQVSICLLRCDAHCDDWKDAGRPSWMPAWTPERRGAQHVRQHCITPATPTSATALRQCPAPPPDGNAPCLSPLLPMMIRQRSTSSPPDRCINATLATAALYGLGSTPTMTTASHLRRLFLLQVSICLLRCDAHCDDWKDAGRPSWMPAWTPERRGAQHVRQHCITPATPTSATALRQCPAPPPDGNAPCLSPLLPMMIRQRSTSSPPDRCINATLATATLYGLGSTPTMTTASHLRRLFLLQVSICLLRCDAHCDDWKDAGRPSWMPAWTPERRGAQHVRQHCITPATPTSATALRQCPAPPPDGNAPCLSPLLPMMIRQRSTSSPPDRCINATLATAALYGLGSTPTMTTASHLRRLFLLQVSICLLRCDAHCDDWKDAGRPSWMPAWTPERRGAQHVRQHCITPATPTSATALRQCPAPPPDGNAPCLSPLLPMMIRQRSTSSPPDRCINATLATAALYGLGSTPTMTTASHLRRLFLLQVSICLLRCDAHCDDWKDAGRPSWMPAWTPERRGAQHVRQHCITPATPTSATALRQCPAPPPDGNAPCLSPLLPMTIRQRSTSSPPDRCINATLATAALYGLGSIPTMTTASHLLRLFLLQVSICLLRCDAHCNDWKDAGRPSWMPAWTPERRGAQHVRQHCITPATPTSATALRQCPAPPPDGNAPCLSPLLPMMIRQRSTSSPPDRCINATLATAALYGLGSTPTMTTASHLRRLFLLQVSICLLRCDAHCDDWKDAGRPSWMPAWTPERRGAQHVRQHCITPATPTSATALRQCPAPPPDGNAPCLSPLLPMMIRQRSTSSPPDRCINATLATAALYVLGSTPTMTTASHLRRLFLLQESICLLRCDAHCDDWKDAGRPSWMPAWTPERRGAQHVRQHCITPATPTSATALRQCPAPPPDGNAPCLSPLLPMMIRQRSTSSPPDRCINATLATAALYGLGSTPTMTTASHLRRLFLLQVSICLLRCDAHCDDWKDAGRPSWMPAWTPERRGAQHVRQHCITPATPTSATALRQCPAPPPDGNAPCLSPLLPMMIRQRSTSSPPDRCINATLATAALYGLGSTPTMTTASHLRRLFLLQVSICLLRCDAHCDDWKDAGRPSWMPAWTPERRGAQHVRQHCITPATPTSATALRQCPVPPPDGNAPCLSPLLPMMIRQRSTSSPPDRCINATLATAALYGLGSTPTMTTASHLRRLFLLQVSICFLRCDAHCDDWKDAGRPSWMPAWTPERRGAQHVRQHCIMPAPPHVSDSVAPVPGTTTGWKRPLSITATSDDDSPAINLLPT
ncbi:hypothetical protein V5799_012087 [Amblyomma americanum]|uniref:Uncharacterized protein n=1 Tax=Amblyomma americanum TaxID=6943 RepID=A0AAQ4EFD0_AMBAM